MTPTPLLTPRGRAFQTDSPLLCKLLSWSTKVWRKFSRDGQIPWGPKNSLSEKAESFPMSRWRPATCGEPRQVVCWAGRHWDSLVSLAWGVQWMELFSLHMNESSAVQWGTVLLKKLFFGWDITLIKLSGGPDHFVGISDPTTSSNDFGVLAMLQLGMLCLLGLPIQLLFRNVVFTKSTFRWAHVKLPFQSWCQNGKRIVKTISDDYW